MKKYFVSNFMSNNGDINIGILPGKFNTKQIILSVLAILTYSSNDMKIHFIRTADEILLAKCNIVIGDYNSNERLNIAIYSDIQSVWNNSCLVILGERLAKVEREDSFIKESIGKKICELEKTFDVSLFYEDDLCSDNSFEEALNIILKIIEKFIKDSLKDEICYYTLKSYIKHSSQNYIKLPIYTRGWRNIVLSDKEGFKIEYAIFGETRNCYRIEAMDEELDLGTYSDKFNESCYFASDFIKTRSIEQAIKIIKKLPTVNN